MRLVFCGTPEFAVGTLEAVIAAGHEVALAVTQPDRVAGRGMEMHAPPVKQAAAAHGIAVVQPEKIRENTEFRARLELVRPDAIVVVAYGRIIPQWMLELPRLGVSICMDRCCRSIEGPRRCSGRWPTASERRA